MRVALLASTIAFMAATPVFAQCVYVACNNGGQSSSVYQQPSYQPPVYQAPMPAPRGEPGYDEGYAAGIAAVRPVAPRTTPRPPRRATAARPAQRVVTRSTARQNGPRQGFNASNIYGRSSSGGARSAATHTVTRHHASTQKPSTAGRHTQVVRRTPARAAHTHRATAAQLATRHRTYTSSNGGTYQDPIKDRAATYRPSTYGQSTAVASMMSRSSSYSQSSTTWSGPASTVNQGGQVCGWGARIVTNGYGHAQSHAVWVCQCPQGWRPPGY